MSTFVICNQPHDESTPVFRSEPITNIAYPHGDGYGNYSLMGAWAQRCKQMDTEYPTHKHWVEYKTN